MTRLSANGDRLQWRGSVLVLDQAAQTLAVVRSLARARYRVIVGRGGVRSEVEYSRYCDEVWRHPPVADTVAFGDALARFLDARPDIDVLFPVGEASAAALCRLPDILSRDIDIAMVPPTLFEACRDKGRANQLARQAGILVPETQTVTCCAEIQAFVSACGLPVIVKPIRSMAKVLGRKAYVVNSEEELHARFDTWPAGHDALLIQRFVKGNVEQCDFVAAKGMLVAYLQAHALRTDMPDGTGFGVDFLSDVVTHDLMTACSEFVRVHNYSGAGLMQLVRSADDGNLYFIENNPRLAAGIAHSVLCGLDVPLLTLQATSRVQDVLLNEVTVGEQSYRTHNRTHWLQRDINGWLAARRTISAAERRRWLSALFWSLVHADHHMTWDWRDPLPSVWIYLRLLRRLTGHFLPRSTGLH